MASPARAAQRHPRVPERDVIVVNCHPDDVSGQYHDTMMQAGLYDSVKDKRWLAYHGLAGGPRIAELRNELVMQMLSAPDAQYMWMVDADMSIQRDTLYRMLAVMEDDPTIKVLGALCFAGGRTWRPKPVIYSEATPGQFKLEENYPEGLCKVAATGAACLLVHRSVLEAIYRQNKDKAYIWFEDYSIGKNQYGEDLMFCRRAREAGFDVYVHTEIEVGHMKAFPMFSELYKLMRNMPPHEAAVFQSAWERAMGKPT